ncbi:Flp family type IVb pilin [Neorhodopirellula lusitana]|nr:Flp family type IVb pilin [Neorhodopirellula lusitana]
MKRFLIRKLSNDCCVKMAEKQGGKPFERVPSLDETMDLNDPPTRRARRGFVAWLNDEDGTTAVEYAVMVALIAVTCIVSVTLMTNAAKESFENSATAIGE